MQVKLSAHAKARINQRGMRPYEIEAFLDLADVVRPIARGLSVLRLSKTARMAFNDAAYAPGLLTRMANWAVIQADDGEVVTCAHVHGRKSANYCRRERCRFWR